MRVGSYRHGGGHGGGHGGHRRGWGYFDSSPVIYYPWPVIDPSLLFDPSMMADQSQMLDPMFDPSQMVDLSQGLDLSRTRGIDPPEDDLSQPLPGPGIIGLYGMFTGDFHRVGDDAQPRRRGLLLLSKKRIKKAWNPRRLRGWR